MEQKYVLVTGASGAIGQAAAKKLASEGYSLYLHYHSNADAIRSLCTELKGYEIETIPIQADLSKPEGPASLCAQIFRLDAIVLNSGKSHFGLVSDVDEAVYTEMQQLHLASPFFIVKQLLPKLLHKQRASIVAVTSIWGDTGASCEVLYSMLKGGQNAFIKALSKELAPSGITVNAVSPGAVQSPMLNQFSDEELEAISDEIPLGRLGRPEEIAGCIAFLLSKEAAYITGQVLKVNGGWYV